MKPQRRADRSFCRRGNRRRPHSSARPGFAELLAIIAAVGGPRLPGVGGKKRLF
ncbi:MAG: hypothetical protein GX410_06845 [Elusimicrobia bacterium]|nr:hypothetical protein [Elusimicrobiota bacterium]